MKTLAKFQGTRVSDLTEVPSRWKPGDYWYAADGTWHCVTPNGLAGWLKNHHVEEHDDGTISVVQGPWGSNSILVGGCSVIDGEKKPEWHGCVERGIWKEF